MLITIGMTYRILNKENKVQFTYKTLLTFKNLAIKHPIKDKNKFEDARYFDRK